MIILGLDEAGRGPVIGPMVMAGVSIKEGDEAKLTAMGVKDSKDLSRAVRERLFEEVKKVAIDYKIIIVSAKEIDEAVESETSNLNILEGEIAVLIANSIKHNRAIMDCPSTNVPAYTQSLKVQMKDQKAELICAHEADRDFVVVGAASILAKVTRDREIEKLKREIGMDFGSGYPSDPKTRRFIELNWNKCPEIFRKSWQTYKKIKRAQSQVKLGRF